MPLASKQPETPSFDGDMISIAGNELLTTNSVYHFFVDPASHQPIQVDQRILAAISKGRFDKGLLEESLATPGMTKEILEILRHGRVRLNWLINSSGGNMNVLDQLIGISESVQKKNGQVDAYVTSKAHSAAAVLFEHTDQRHVLDDSDVFWHRGNLNIYRNRDISEIDIEKILRSRPSRIDHDRYKNLEEKAKAKRKIYPIPEGYRNGTDGIANFLTRTAYRKKSAKLLKELEKAKSDPANTDDDFEMTGKQLAENGIAQSHKTTEAIQRKLLQKTQVERPIGIINDQISLFFAASSFEETTRRDTGLDLEMSMRRDKKGIIKISMAANPETDDQKRVAKEIAGRLGILAS